MMQHLTTQHLASFILGSLKDENSGRVALYHYLKNFSPAHESLNPTLFNDFFAQCLQITYWQEHKKELHEDIKDLLTRFFASKKLAFSPDKIWDLSKTQIVPVTACENLYLAVKNFEHSVAREADSVRVIPDGESRMVVLIKNAQGLFTVRTYSNLCRIQGNQLIPLSADQELIYNQVLELQPHVVQKTRLAPHHQIRFEINEEGVIAQSVTGSAFRQAQIFKMNSLMENSALFFHLKKLEKFYIHRASDPYYVELLTQVDKACTMLKNNEIDAVVFARGTFEMAQIAFDQIFPDDKIVFMKLKELTRLMVLKNQQREVLA
jgi:hypothetical protein